MNTELRDTRNSIQTLEALLRAQRREADVWEAQMQADIACAVDDMTGKPLFSNAEKRDAELAIRQSQSSAWQITQQRMDEIEADIARLRTTASYLANDIAFTLTCQDDEDASLRRVTMDVYHPHQILRMIAEAAIDVEEPTNG